MTHPRFFGYGSLVNLGTHSYPDPQPATITGWRRIWRHAKDRPVAFLSVEPSPNTTLHGITAEVPNADWVALDAREHGYTRHDVTPQFDTDTAIYQADPAFTVDPSVGHPILLSYLDVVIAGFQTLMGDAGPAHFFETTDGWSNVMDDRADPIYPRALPLSDKTRQTVDAGLSALSVLVQPAHETPLLVQSLRAGIAAVARPVNQS